MCHARLRAILSAASRRDEPPLAAPVAGGEPVRSTDFGATTFDVVAPAAARVRGPQSAFDVCHVGVVLRALLFVHGAMAIGMVFGATTFAVWLALDRRRLERRAAGGADLAARRVRAQGAARARAAGAAVAGGDRARRDRGASWRRSSSLAVLPDAPSAGLGG